MKKTRITNHGISHSNEVLKSKEIALPNGKVSKSNFNINTLRTDILTRGMFQNTFYPESLGFKVGTTYHSNLFDGIIEVEAIDLSSYEVTLKFKANGSFWSNDLLIVELLTAVENGSFKEI
ncbi:MAG: hypothetical protein V4663_06060 [Bacteroidota bacterium]